MNATLKLLLSSKDNILINTQLAVEIGLNEAIVLRQVYYWVEHYETEKKNFKDGKYWVYNSMKQWRSDNFPFMSEKTIERAFKSLREKELILVGDYSSDRMKRPNWYTINDKKFEKLMKKIMGMEDNSDEREEENKEAAKTRETECPNRVRQNDGMQSDRQTGCYNIYNNINNTDTENTNRDYITETTDNSTSNDVDVLNSPFLEMEKSVCVDHKPVKAVKETADREVPMPIRAGRIAYQIYGNKGMANNVSSFVDYFLKKRKEKTGEEHIPLKDVTLQRIVLTITESIEVCYAEKDYCTICEPLIPDWEDDSYKKIVDAYFEQKFRMKVDYSLPHFAQNNIISMLMMKVDKDHWCRNEKCGFFGD